jgi:hypothetical protein
MSAAAGIAAAAAATRTVQQLVNPATLGPGIHSSSPTPLPPLSLGDVRRAEGAPASAPPGSAHSLSTLTPIGRTAVSSKAQQAQQVSFNVLGACMPLPKGTVQLFDCSCPGTDAFFFWADFGVVAAPQLVGIGHGTGTYAVAFTTTGFAGLSADAVMDELSRHMAATHVTESGFRQFTGVTDLTGARDFFLRGLTNSDTQVELASKWNKKYVQLSWSRTAHLPTYSSSVEQHGNLVLVTRQYGSEELASNNLLARLGWKPQPAARAPLQLTGAAATAAPLLLPPPPLAPPLLASAPLPATPTAAATASATAASAPVRLALLVIVVFNIISGHKYRVVMNLLFVYVYYYCRGPAGNRVCHGAESGYHGRLCPCFCRCCRQ